MMYESVLLNGSWRMDYSPYKYTEESCPIFDGVTIKDAVPGYFEDMSEKFRGAPFFESLVINPDYKRYEYPMTDYPPDMVLPNYVGNFFYERSFTVDEPTDAVLYFEGVQNSAAVWINGEFICSHEGYSAPFEVEIPHGVLKSGENKITLSVSNHDIFGFDGQQVSGITSRAASRFSGGITGDVELKLYKSPVRDLFVTVNSDCSAVNIAVSATQDVEAEWYVIDGDKVVKQGKCKTNFTFDTQNLEFWSPENPKLYKIRVVYGDAFIEKNFGVRRLLADGAHFKLNGEPYYLRGICEHCYYPETVHPPHDKAFYIKVISKLKELGFNFIRFHTYVPPKEYLEAADELGMLIQIESPNNTSLEEWEHIIRFCKNYISPVIYCCGNELQIDDAVVEHLSCVADRVHSLTDGLFSPMSALRGVEYGKIEEEQTVCEPFRHNPRRFKMLSEFSDLYNSFSLEHFSYHSLDAFPELVSSWHSVYKKPRITHEICIDGSYTDLSLKKRYDGTRIGKTALFSSIENHLTERGLIGKAPLYFKNSCEWQRRLRKYCFEATRRCENMAGYDFLGPIDTHWHTFGYDVGMMNEFYELKPGETVQNVLRYNSPTVLLTDLNKKRNFASGEELSCSIMASVYQVKESDATLNVRLEIDGKTAFSDSVAVTIENGKLYKLYDLKTRLLQVKKPVPMKLSASLTADGTISANEWELYLFPVSEVGECEALIADSLTEGELIDNLEDGRDVILFGAEPFKRVTTSFRMSLAGRTNGFTATVIDNHPILENLPHEGFCSWQFCSLLEGGSAVVFDNDSVAFEPIIEVVSTHKNAVKESALFEFAYNKARLLVCSFAFADDDPAARWLKAEIIKYASGNWQPKNKIDKEALTSMFGGEILENKNVNLAVNKNDITAVKK